jgi:hypothetical protein
MEKNIEIPVIEVVEFYPNKITKKGHKLEGTLHIYIIDWDVDIKGINVTCKANGYWFFGMPNKLGWDVDEKDNIRYPIFSFMDRERQRMFMAQIKKQGTEYINKEFLSKKKPKRVNTKKPTQSKVAK